MKLTPISLPTFGTDVSAGDKAIAATANGSRRNADVISAIQFRRYCRFKGIRDQSYSEGICFYSKKGDRIANYPRQHSANLTYKHQESSRSLKPMVRILKNLRGKLVDDNLIKKDIAPSYYLESLLYNVPSGEYRSTYQDSLDSALRWIQESADKSNLVCANEQYYLLRQSVNTCWDPANCEKFLEAAIKLWNEW